MKSFKQYSSKLLSKSSPPKWQLPDVAFTSNIPSEMFNIEQSKVPPPQSYISMFYSLSVVFYNPYANAAAVGSLIILSISSPAIAPASYVAFLY